MLLVPCAVVVVVVVVVAAVAVVASVDANDAVLVRTVIVPWLQREALLEA